MLKRAFASAASAAREVVTRRLPPTFPVDTLFEFNKTHGSTPHNFIPDGPVREHLSKLSTGDTIVWGAFVKEELVGFISAGKGSEYWHQINATHEEGKSSFIHEFVVRPDMRGFRIGARLTEASVDPETGIFSKDIGDVAEIYTTVHSENVASRTAFVKSKYEEVLTYHDAARERDTTVLKCTREAAEAAAAGDDIHMRVVGLQSGNAVDGIDVGIFDMTLRGGKSLTEEQRLDLNQLAGRISYKTLANKTFSFTEEERAFVLKLRALACEDGNDYALANYRLGTMFANCVNSLLEETGIDKATVDLIGSHGQTISGHPHWELGDVSSIAVQTGITTAGDFRPADVAAGGNGTPCTCTYDSLMLRPEAGTDGWRVAINIGGTSSVTFCPPTPAAGEEAAAVLPHGLDPGLGVFFMDLATADIDPALPFDDGGRIARSGKIHEGLVQEMMEWRYYKQAELPIGVGPDDFPQELFQQWRTRAGELGLSKEDFLATLTDHSTYQIAAACKRFGGAGVVDAPLHDVVMRGGVTHNAFWMERLRVHLASQLGEDAATLRIHTLDDIGLEEESWENAMYAMFGFLCRNGCANFAPKCTGASRTVVGGKIASAAGLPVAK